jgi:hypothetical protein
VSQRPWRRSDPSVPAHRRHSAPLGSSGTAVALLTPSPSVAGPDRRSPFGRGWLWMVAAVAGAVVSGAAVIAGYGLELLAVAAITPFLLLVYRRPQRAVLLLVALAPFDGLLVLVHSSSIKSYKEILTVVMLLATFVCPREARAPLGRRRPGWLLPLLLLLAVAAISIADVGLHTGLTGYRIDYFYILLGWGVWRCPLARRDTDHLVTLLMALGFVTAVYGIAQQVIGASRLAAAGYPYNTVIRFTGSHLRSFSTFAQPFPFAYYLMLVLLVCAPIALRDRTRLRNRAFLCVVPVLFVGLVLAFVRGAILGLVAGLLYLAVRRHRSILLIGPLVLVIVLWLPSSITGSVFQSHSLGARAAGWQANISHVLDHPFGQGEGSSGAGASALASTAASTAIYQPDDYYYNTLYQVGLPGLWFFLLAFGGMIGEAHAAVKRRSIWKSDLALGVTAFLLAAATASLVSTFFEIFPMDLMTCLLVATVAAQERVATPADDPLPAEVAV